MPLCYAHMLFYTHFQHLCASWHFQAIIQNAHKNMWMETQLILSPSSSSLCTWRVVQHSELRLLLREHAEHHVARRLAAAVLNPGGEGPDRAQRADVHDDARQAGPPRERAQNSSRQTEGGAHVQRQVRVQLFHLGEITTVTGHITERSCGTHNSRTSAVYTSLRGQNREAPK